MRITEIPCDLRYEKIVPETIFRAGAYFSKTRKHILFAPHVQGSWDPQNPDCCYYPREPVTMLPITSPPQAIGNRIRAVLACSIPHEDLRASGQEEILRFFQNVPDREALFAEQAAQGIPPFLQDQGRVIDRLVSVGINQFDIQRIGEVPWDTERFPRSSLDMRFTYEMIRIYATSEVYLFTGALASEFQNHPEKPDPQCLVTDITVSDTELGELALRLWRRLDSFREQLSKS